MIPGTIPGCPMPGEPMDPGILSILGFLGPSWDVPCEGSQWILEYLVPQDSWDHPGMSHVRGVLEYLVSRDSLDNPGISNASGARGSWNTAYLGITTPKCRRLQGKHTS